MIILLLIRILTSLNHSLSTTAITYLRPQHLRLINAIARSPRLFILAPIALAFVLAYPALYALLISPAPSSLARDIHITGHVDPYKYTSLLLSPLPSPYMVKQLWLLAGNSSIFSASFLQNALSLQDKLLDGLNTSLTFLITPLSSWNCSRALIADPAPLKTLASSAPDFFAGVVSTNGIISSASAFRILLLAPLGHPLLSQWDANLHSHAINPAPNTYTELVLQLSSPMYVMGTLVFLVVVLYALVALRHVHGVRSRCGLALAFCVQTGLADLLGASFANWLGPERSWALSGVLAFLALENSFRLLGAASVLHDAVFVPSRFAAAIAGRAVTLSAIVILCALGFALVSLISQYRALCGAALVTLLVDHALYLTFFTAVFSVDVRRLELQDLLTGNGKKSPIASRYLDKQRRRLAGAFEPRAALRQAFTRLVTSIRLPITNRVLCTSLALGICAFGALFNVRGEKEQLPDALVRFLQDQGSYHPDSPVFQQFLESSESSLPSLLALAKSFLQQNHVTEARFYVQSATFYGPEPCFNNVHRLDLYFFLEFFAALGFVVAVSAVAIRVYLRESTEERALDHTQNTSIDPKQFGARDLVQGGHVLDIVRIASNRTCPFVVLIGMDHRVLVWSPAAPSAAPVSLPVARLMWPITHAKLLMHGNLIAIFLRRGQVKVWSRILMVWICTVEIAELRDEMPLECFFRKKTVLARRKAPEVRLLLRQNSSSSMRSKIRALDSAYQLLPPGLSEKDLELMFEFTLVLKSGKMMVVDLKNGLVQEITAVKEPLVAATLLVSPRVNDRVVFVGLSGAISVATVINNRWKTRSLLVQENRYNRGKLLMTPLAMGRNPTRPQPSTPDLMTNVLAPVATPEELAEQELIPVAFVGMVVRTRGLIAELIDVTTGTLVKRFHIGQFKKGTFRVFHAAPTHCRFCGCASVLSFLLVYTELETGMLIMHTFLNSNRAKNIICLRVERDPRETRCLGFDSVLEHQHWLEGVECWELTDVNMVEGVRRREAPQMTLRQRKKKTVPKILEVWEGFTMSAAGHVMFHEIPDGGEGLLVKKIFLIARFGHKSVVVPFGNVMKVLYLGNDDLLMQNLDEDGNVNQKTSGLSFINKRRMRRNELNNTPDFVELVRIIQNRNGSEELR